MQCDSVNNVVYGIGASADVPVAAFCCFSDIGRYGDAAVCQRRIDHQQVNVAQCIRKGESHAVVDGCGDCDIT